MKFLRSITLAVIAASIMISAAVPVPAGAAASATKPVPTLRVGVAYKQFVSARAAFVQYRAFANPALVRWGTDGVRYLRVSRVVVDFRTTMTFDIAGAEGAYVPAERAALWIRVRRTRAPDGKVQTTWYDAHGGKGFERTTIVSLLTA